MVASNPGVTGLEAWWELNEATGVRYDAHGSNDLADNNSVGASTDSIQGNSAYFQSANSEFLSIADNASLSFGNEGFTLATWANAITLATSAIVAKDLASNREYALFYIRTPTFRFQLMSSHDGSTAVSVNADTFGAPSTDVWYFIAIQHDPTADTLGISVNNGAFDTGAQSGGMYDGTAAFYIGGREWSGSLIPWDGLIDETCVYRRVLASG